MGKLFLHSLRREALGARKGAKTQRRKGEIRFISFFLASLRLRVVQPKRRYIKAMVQTF
jgi:hypothetical protein